MSTILAVVTLVFALLVALPAVYLAILAGVTFVSRRPPRSESAKPLRFAILVPAHDEESAIARTTTALLRLDYPPDCFTVHVVADNCADATAAVARASGAFVHERDDPSRPGKGAALNWLVRRVSSEVGDVDAFVLVDADSELSANFLRVMADHLGAGAQAVQALHLVDVAEDRPLVRIRELAFELTCHLRPLANTILGGSSGLQGTGMGFAAPLLLRYPWSETSVVEDGELALRLIRDGHRIALATTASVRQAMPTTFSQAGSQAVRWERGRFDHFDETVSLICRGLRRRDRNSLLTGLNALIPPFSALAAATVLGLAVAAALGDMVLAVLALASIVSLLVYTLRGASLGGLTPRTLLRIVLWAPPYVAWKLWVLALAGSGVGRGQWTRTKRAA